MSDRRECIVSAAALPEDGRERWFETEVEVEVDVGAPESSGAFVGIVLVVEVGVVDIADVCLEE